MFLFIIIIVPVVFSATLKPGHDSLIREKRQFLNQRRLPFYGAWANATVNYYFNESSFDFGLQKSVLHAMDKISSHTCVQFSTEPSDVMLQVFTNEKQICQAAIGKVGPPHQNLNFVYHCYSSGMVVHELIHVLGFVHAHQRLDRDKFLEVNMQKVAQSDYNRMQYSIIGPQTLFVPYDYGSVMQYAPTKDVFEPRDQSYRQTMGSEIVSFYDYLMINYEYQCFEQCENAEKPECKNGGYQNPASCSECNCPYGFGGVDCSQRPDPGLTLEATDAWQSTNFSLDAGVVKLDDGRELRLIDFIYHFLWITAPVNKTIEVEVKMMDGVSCEEGCISGGIEVKTIENPQMTSPRLCCVEDSKVYKSFHSPTVVMAFNARGLDTYSIHYRYVDN